MILFFISVKLIKTTYLQQDCPCYYAKQWAGIAKEHY